MTKANEMEESQEIAETILMDVGYHNVVHKLASSHLKLIERCRELEKAVDMNRYARNPILRSTHEVRIKELEAKIEKKDKKIAHLNWKRRNLESLANGRKLMVEQLEEKIGELEKKANDWDLIKELPLKYYDGKRWMPMLDVIDKIKEFETLLGEALEVIYIHSPVKEKIRKALGEEK